MNLSFLIPLLTISFVKPVPIFLCNDDACNSLYMPSTVRLDSCECNQTSNTYVYPRGNNDIFINYNMSYPIQHDFYQNDTLIGSCPLGLLCNKMFKLNPRDQLTTVITEYPRELNTATADANANANADADDNTDDDTYYIIFYP
jgi:hypothetical protein